MAHREFLLDSDLWLYGEIYDHRSNGGEVNAEVTVKSADGTVVYKAPFEAAPVQFGHFARIPLKEIGTGPFVATIEARSSSPEPDFSDAHRHVSGEMRNAISVIIALSTALLHAQTEPGLEDVLGRMHAYLNEYAKQLPAMIATERYQQRFGSGMRRSQRLLVSDYGLIQVQGDSEWLGFREVLSVDGKQVTDSARRLTELLAKPSAACAAAGPPDRRRKRPL